MTNTVSLDFINPIACEPKLIFFFLIAGTEN